MTVWIEIVATATSLSIELSLPVLFICISFVWGVRGSSNNVPTINEVCNLLGATIGSTALFLLPLADIVVGKAWVKDITKDKSAQSVIASPMTNKWPK